MILVLSINIAKEVVLEMPKNCTKRKTRCLLFSQTTVNKTGLKMRQNRAQPKGYNLALVTYCIQYWKFKEQGL